MGPVTLSGALAGSPERATFKGNFQARGNWIDASVDATLGNRPNITADLQAHGPLDLDKLSAGSGAPVAAARPAPGRGGQPAAAAAPPIDTAAMRSLDASIKLTAATMIMSPMRIANAELAATLKNGVITLQRFKGGLYGGTLDLTGTVNGSGPVLAFDVKGSATGLSIGDILRSTAGTNVFGDRVKASIDGRLNATGIEFRGSGATSVALKNSLSGGMALGGFVLLGVDRALLAVGSLAGGAVGAAGSVVDNTVGSVLSGVTGQRLATDLGSDANAIILLVNRFANRDNPISGRLDIASGTATTNGLTVQGNRATANISSRTNLMNSTTDTTVNFFIAEQPSTTYLTTSARGPTSSPSLSVSRGAAARDQPSSSGPSLPIPGVGRLPLPLPNLPGLFGR
jgi:AsmA-like protein